MADKQTCHVTHAHWCVKDPRSGARPSSRLLLRRKEEGDAQRRPRQRHETRFCSFPILFLSASSSSLDALKRSISKVVHRDKNAIASLLSKTPAFCAFEKRTRRRRKRKRRRRASTNAPSGDVSLRRGHADGLGGSSLGQGEHYFVGVVLCVYLKVRTTRVFCAPPFSVRAKISFLFVGVF